MAEICNLQFTVHWVKSLPEGLRVLGKGGFDLVLLALDFQDEKGIDVLQASMDAIPPVPMILLVESNAGRIHHVGLQHFFDEIILKGELTAALLSRSLRHATELHHLRQEVRETNQEVENITRSVHNLLAAQAEGMLVVDDSWTIKYANPAAQAILDIQSILLREVSFGLPVGAGRVAELKIPRKDRLACVWEFRATTLTWEGKNAHLIAIRDVTGQKLATTTSLPGEQ